MKIFLTSLALFSSIAFAKNYVVEEGNLKYEFDLIPEVRTHAVDLYLQMNPLGSLKLLNEDVGKRRDNFDQDINFNIAQSNVESQNLENTIAVKSNKDYVNCLIDIADMLSFNKVQKEISIASRLEVSNSYSSCDELLEDNSRPLLPKDIYLVTSVVKSLKKEFAENFKELFMDARNIKLSNNQKSFYQHIITMIANDATLRGKDYFDLRWNSPKFLDTF